ncbi:MAG: YaaL family protein [Clostridia bacterium]|nr:YaaL family protein [Clostridia bacterium]
MQEHLWKKEEKVVQKTEFMREVELINSIIKTREELKVANINFELVDNELIDYYIYQIKANQAKLDYLLRLAKAKGIVVDRVNELKYRNALIENNEAV